MIANNTKKTFPHDIQPNFDKTFINYNELIIMDERTPEARSTSPVDLEDVMNMVEPKAIQIRNQMWELKDEIADLKKELGRFVFHPEEHILAFYLDEAERYDPETSEFHKAHMEIVDYRDEYSGWNEEYSNDRG